MTKIEQQVREILHELRRSVQRQPVSTFRTETATQAILKLIQQARVDEVEGLSQELLHPEARFAINDTEGVSVDYITETLDDRLAELNQKEGLE